jgi:hypothetical protein
LLEGGLPGERDCKYSPSLPGDQRLAETRPPHPRPEACPPTPPPPPRPFHQGRGGCPRAGPPPPPGPFGTWGQVLDGILNRRRSAREAPPLGPFGTGRLLMGIIATTATTIPDGAREGGGGGVLSWHPFHGQRRGVRSASGGPRPTTQPGPWPTRAWARPGDGLGCAGPALPDAPPAFDPPMTDGPVGPWCERSESMSDLSFGAKRLRNGIGNTDTERCGRYFFITEATSSLTAMVRCGFGRSML